MFTYRHSANCHTLPEGQKNNALDGAEFQDRLEGREQIPSSRVEEKQSIECQRHANIVNARYIEVSTVNRPVSISVVSHRLQYDDDKGHDGLDQAELQGRLLTESQKSYRVGLTRQAIGAVQATRPYGLAPDLGHDVALAAQVLVAERQKVVNDESLVAVAYREEVDIVALVVEKEQRYPGVGRVNRYYEQYSDDPTLLRGIGVPPEVLVDLLAADEESGGHEHPGDVLGGLSLQEDGRHLGHVVG